MNRLLLITDGFDASTAARVRAALAVVPDAAIMLRAKSLDGGALFLAARELRAIARTLIVNDRVDVALAAGADGVHLPARGLPLAAARALVGERLVGVSTHAPEEVIAAARSGADYVVFGPVWPTPNKAPAVGVAALAAVVKSVAPLPVFALGGVDAARARQVVAAGAGIACIGAVLGAHDSAAGARALAAAIM